jgi:type II secretory pathway pseudopilin PulG
MTVVVAIVAVLAALALPAVTGITTDTRTSTKRGDLKEVEQAITRYESDNGGFPASTPITGGSGVTDNDSNGMIHIWIDNSGLVGAAPAVALDKTCSGVTTATAWQNCFAPITLASLIPGYLKVAPRHVTDSVTTLTGGNVTGDGNQDTPDLTIANCDLAGHTCLIYLDGVENLTASGMKVWNIDRNGTVFAFRDDTKYGAN